MKLVVLTLLVALCGAESQFDSREGLTHVVRVGRNGRQVVHKVGDSIGQKVGRKVRRQGRRRQNNNNLVINSGAQPIVQPLRLVDVASTQQLSSLRPVNANTIQLVPRRESTIHPGNPFGFQHAHFNSLPVVQEVHLQPAQGVQAAPIATIESLPPAPIAARLLPTQPLPLSSVGTPIQHQVHLGAHHFHSIPAVQQIQPAQVVQEVSVDSSVEALPPAPIAARAVPQQVQPLRSVLQPLQPHPLTHSVPLQALQPVPAPTQIVQGPVQPLASVFTPLHHNGVAHVSHFTPIQQTQVLTPIQSQPIAPAAQAQAPAAQPEAPAVIAARTTPALQPVTFKSIPLEFGNPATIAPEVKVQSPPSAYGAPAPAIDAIPTSTPAPLAPAPVLVPVPAPAPVPAPLPVAPQGVIAARVTQSEPVAVVKSDLLASRRSEPIAIVRSHANVPALTPAFDYSFESANGIKQEATGVMRTVDDTEVSVMKGSYEYVGPDSIVYTVQWYADQTGFHATAPHIPTSVEPNHPEVAAAVKAQLAFAEEQRALRRASASTEINSYVAPAVVAKAVEPAPSYAAPSQDYLPAYE